MKTWVIALLVLTIIVLSSGCSSSGPEGSLAFAPGTDGSAVNTRDASSLSWGSPIVVDRQRWGGNREGASIDIVDGNPAVSYVVFSTKRHTYTFTLYYARAVDSSGASWGKAKAVDIWGGGTVGTTNCYTSLREVNSRPAICYMASTDGNSPHELRYVRAKDSTGNQWNSPLTIDNSGDTGTAAQMITANGNPAISYIDFNSGGSSAGKYIHALDQNGDTWGAPVVIDPSVGAKLDTIAAVNGHPAMAYAIGGAGHELRFIRAADANGDTWGSPQIIQSGATDGRYALSRVIVVDGCPAIAFSGNGLLPAGSVYFIRATDADGTAWPANAVSVSSGGTFDWLGSVTVANGLPSIAFVTGNQTGVNPLGYPIFDGYSLSFSQALDSSGGSWEPAETLADLGTAANPAIAATGSGAGIAYYDSSRAMNYINGQ